MKRCPLCGKEYEHENMCQTCGVVLIDTETNSAVVTAPEKRRRTSKKKETMSKTPTYSDSSSETKTSAGLKPVYIIVIAIVLVIVIIAAVFMIKSTKAKKEAEQMYQQQNVAAEEQNVQGEADDVVEENVPEVEENATETVETVPVISMDNIELAGASSELSESNMTHSAERVLDGKSNTAWVEGTGGQGIDETITLAFDKEYLVSGFRIQAGYQKDDYAYYNNSRPKEIQIEFSDGSIEMFTLEDAFGVEQNFTFAEPKETYNMRIVIKAVYPGSKYEDTCISEISLF